MHRHPFLLLWATKRHQKNVRARFPDALCDSSVIHLEQRPERRRIEIDRELGKIPTEPVCSFLGGAGQSTQQEKSIILPRCKADQLRDEIGTRNPFRQWMTEKLRRPYQRRSVAD